MNKHLAQLLSALLFTTTLCAEAPTWPCFNGPNMDNISTEKGLLKAWPEGGPKLLWRSDDVGLGYGNVSVAGDTLYIAGDFGEDAKVTALSLDGKVKWQAEAGGAWNGEFSGESATPTYNDGMVYFMSGLSNLVALDAATGKRKWKEMVSLKYGGRRGLYGYSESLMVDGDNLIVLPGGKYHLLVALEKKTGKKVWSTPNYFNDTASFASPLIRDINGTREVITAAQSAIFSVNAATGEMLWFGIFKDPHDVNAITPVYYDGYIFYANGYAIGSRGLKLDPDGRGISTAWFSKGLDCHHGGVIGIDGYVYGSGDIPKKWYCLDIKTGKEMWSTDAFYKGSVTCADGMLYAFSEKGKAGLIEARPDKFNLVSSFDIPVKSQDLLIAHPVVAGGRLYIRAAGTLLVYDIKASGR